MFLYVFLCFENKKDLKTTSKSETFFPQNKIEIIKNNYNMSLFKYVLFNKKDLKHIQNRKLLKKQSDTFLGLKIHGSGLKSLRNPPRFWKFEKSET